MKLPCLSAVTLCSINPITNPSPVYNQYNTRDNMLHEFQSNENCKVLCLLCDVKLILVGDLMLLCSALFLA
jgi:hypothetical protein